MSMTRKGRHPLEFRQVAVERMKRCENIVALSEELGVSKISDGLPPCMTSMMFRACKLDSISQKSPPSSESPGHHAGAKHLLTGRISQKVWVPKRIGRATL